MHHTRHSNFTAEGITIRQLLSPGHAPHKNFMTKLNTLESRSALSSPVLVSVMHLRSGLFRGAEVDSTALRVLVLESYYQMLPGGRH